MRDADWYLELHRPGAGFEMTENRLPLGRSFLKQVE